MECFDNRHPQAGENASRRARRWWHRWQPPTCHSRLMNQPALVVPNRAPIQTGRHCQRAALAPNL